jgi:hypothetical protein
METQPLHTEDFALPSRPVSASEHAELQPHEIAILLTVRHKVTDDEIEVIEMRYQQALALNNLEDLFAEGQFDRM